MPLRDFLMLFYHHLAAALATLTGLLVVAEWLIPGSVLPYLPLWPFPTALGLLMILTPDNS